MGSALVTGHEGFVGRHLTDALLDRGWWVTGVDLKSGDDCRDLFECDDTHFDLVVHCAAVVGGRLTISNDPLAVAVDLAIDSDLFRWAERTRPGRVVYFSSSAAYPTWLQTPGHRLVESDLCLDAVGTPDLTYGWAKLTGELLASFSSVPVHIFRPFSGYGTDQDLAYPFPAYVQRGATRADPFDVWGDGEQVRDFVHIDDIVGAVIAAIYQDVRGPVNLGTGRATSFNQLAALVADAAGYQPNVRNVMDKPVGPQWRVADPTLMETFYKPSVTLEEGIARALR